MRKALTGAAVFLVLGAAALFGVKAPLLADTGGALEPKQLIDTYELMGILFEPYQLGLDAAMETEPETRSGWIELYRNAYALGELSNLLLFREGEEYMEGSEWREMTVASRTAAVELAQSARTRDFEAARRQYGVLMESCNACHTAFAEGIAPVFEY